MPSELGSFSAQGPNDANSGAQEQGVQGCNCELAEFYVNELKSRYKQPNWERWQLYVCFNNEAGP